jgi:predicted NUDIX family NTP pyrophosphohydrolase
MCRKRNGAPEVLLAHPGGPFWASKDAGAWTIPKGLCEPGEEPLSAAIREFTEETGFVAKRPFFPLGSVKMKSGKEVFAWAFEGDCDIAELKGNLCSIEWPPRSGKRLQTPEIDRVAFFTLDEARSKILPAQAAFIDRVARQGAK